MKKFVYDSIINDLKDLTDKYGVNEMKIIIDIISDKYSFDYNLIYSLISYEFRREFPNKYSNRKANLHFIYQEWIDNKRTTILELAKKYNVSAYPLLTFIINKLSTNKTITKQWLKDSNYCPDGRLAYEIMTINNCDMMNGIYIQHINRVVGLKFELKIENYLKLNNISFQCEKQLREQNYDVTPDFRLNLPLILINNNNNNDGDDIKLYRINELDKIQNEQNDKLINNKNNNDNDNDERITLITWIECKAMFASIDCHCDYYQQQYQSYINRFGNGIVLYQMGFIEIEAIPKEFIRNIIIMQQMPEFAAVNS